MNRLTCQATLALGLCTSIATAHAANPGFAGAIGIQYKQLDMEQTFSGLPDSLGIRTSGDLSASLPVINLQAIFFYNSFYLSGKFETDLASSSTSSTIPFTTAGTDLDTEVGRDDSNITAGYRISDQVSIFGGYMMGKTELIPDTCANCSNLASVMQRAGYSTYRQHYRESGFFAGVSLGKNLQHGRISTSIAYALMDGEYTDNYRDANGSNEFNYQGDSTGLSLAVAWSAPITESLFYFIDARIQQYDMDASDHAGTGIYQNTNVKTQESITGISGGLQLKF